MFEINNTYCPNVPSQDKGVCFIAVLTSEEVASGKKMWRCFVALVKLPSPTLSDGSKYEEYEGLRQKAAQWATVHGKHVGFQEARRYFYIEEEDYIR